MRVVGGVLVMIFGLYAAFESYAVAAVGWTYQIPQLEGDGGGGLAFAAMLILSGAIFFLRPLVSAVISLLAASLVTLMAIMYLDNILFLWGAASVIFAAFGFTTYRRQRKKRGDEDKANPSNTNRRDLSTTTTPSANP